jgi:hypothetical protein
MNKVSKPLAIAIAVLVVGLVSLMIGLAAMVKSSSNLRRVPNMLTAARSGAQGTYEAPQLQSGVVSDGKLQPRLRVLGDETLLKDFREWQSRRLFSEGLTTDDVTEMSRAENPFARSLAVGLVRRLGGGAGRDILCLRLNDVEPGIRAQAALVLADLVEQSALEPLAKVAKNDPDPRVRSGAAKALGKIKAKSHTDLLLQMMDDEKIVKCSAIESLGDLDYDKARDRLRKMFRESDMDISLSCSYALFKLGQKDMVNFLFDALRHKDPTVRASALRLLAEVGASDVMKPVIQRLQDESQSVRFAAIGALVKLRNPIATSDLKRVAEKDSDWAVRQAAQIAMDDLAWQFDKDKR